MRGLASVLVLAAWGCGCDGVATPRQRPDAGQAGVRKVKPPPDNRTPHVYPPHAIRPDGVGPYLLDAPLADVLHIAPEGPRYEQLELGDLLSWFLVRAENNRLLIGADERSRRVEFIVVLAASVARTDGGMTVGMSGAALLAAFGPARVERDVVRARRVYEFEKLPNVQFLTADPPGTPDQDTRVVAVLVSRPQLGRAIVPTPATPAPAGTRAPPVLRPPPGGKPMPRPERGATAAAAREAARAAPCRSGGALASVPAAELWAAAHPARSRPGAVVPSSLKVSWGCVTSDDPEALVLAGEELSIVGGAPGKLKKLTTTTVGAVDQVSPLDVDGDGRDELVALTLSRAHDALALQLRTWTWDGGRLTTVASQRVFEVSREAAATAGVTPAGIDLWTEVRPGPGALVVGGLYVERGMAGVRALAPLQPVRVRLEPRRAAPTTAESGGAAEAVEPTAKLDAGSARPDAAPAVPVPPSEGADSAKEETP